jgi:hypothetical protein
MCVVRQKVVEAGPNTPAFGWFPEFWAHFDFVLKNCRCSFRFFAAKSFSAANVS